MPQFPSLKARQLRRVLERGPLLYTSAPSADGSHTKLVSGAGYPKLNWAFHDGQSLPPGMVRTILVKQVGLTAEEALRLL